MKSLPRVWNHLTHSRLLQQSPAYTSRREQLTSLSCISNGQRQRTSARLASSYGLAQTMSTNAPLLPVSPAITSLLLCNKEFRIGKSTNAFDSCTCHAISLFFRPRYSRRHSEHQTRRYCSKSYLRYRPVMDAPEGLFRGNVDRFNGIIVESEVEYEENVDFAQKLSKSLDYWIEIKRRGIWFNVRTEHADWVPHLAKAGFEFHHAKNGFVMMYRWLPIEEYANIPDYCHTMLGVGGLVVNKNNEVLVVSDRYAYIPNSWKLPGGFVEASEDLTLAAIREVREETGIECKFDTVISIRHSHGGTFGCSDMYVVIALTPLNLDLHKCEREIERIQWMPMAEFLEHPHVHETNRHFLRTFLDYRKRGIRFTYERAKHQILKKEYSLYFIQPADKDAGTDKEAKL